MKSFYFMMGEDLLENLQEWDNSDELCKEIPFLIFQEKKTMILIKIYYQKLALLLKTTFIAASSAEIRQRIKRNLNVFFLFTFFFFFFLRNFFCYAFFF